MTARSPGPLLLLLLLALAGSARGDEAEIDRAIRTWSDNCLPPSSDRQRRRRSECRDQAAQLGETPAAAALLALVEARADAPEVAAPLRRKLLAPVRAGVALALLIALLTLRQLRRR